MCGNWMGQTIDPIYQGIRKENKESDCIICHMRILNLLGNVLAEYGEYIVQYNIIMGCPYANLVNSKLMNPFDCGPRGVCIMSIGN